MDVFVGLRFPAISSSSSASLSEEDEEEELDEGALLRLCLTLGVLVVTVSSSESDIEESELLALRLVPDKEDEDALLVVPLASLSSDPLLLSPLSVSELELCWLSLPLSFQPHLNKPFQVSATQVNRIVSRRLLRSQFFGESFGRRTEAMLL